MAHRLIALATLCLVSLWTSTALATPIMMMTEYVETAGWRNNAIEITNVGSSPGSLAGFTIDIYNNGSNNVIFPITLDAVTLAPGETWVVISTAADDPALIAAADQLANWFIFTGDDAIVLASGGTPVDSIGQVGVDPGQAWGSGATTTRGATLRRDASQGPDPNPNDAFDPATEGWTGAPDGDVSGLGSPPAGVPEPPTMTLLLGSFLLYTLGRRPRAGASAAPQQSLREASTLALQRWWVGPLELYRAGS